MPKLSKERYDQASLKKAIEEVHAGEKIRSTATKYGIPKSTLFFKLKNPDHKETFGPSPVLTKEEEDELASWIIQLAKKGFPRKKEDLQTTVQEFLTKNPRDNPFKNNRPGDGWVKSFLKRHREIVTRTSEGVSYASSCVTEKDIRKWFTEIREYLSSKNILDILNDPSRVYNGDETAFQMCPQTGRVLAAKGTSNVYNVEHSSSKENVTVMFTFAASGKTCPPLIVYAYQRIPQKVAESVPDGWGIARSKNGWMTSQVFFEYIGNVFHPYLIKNNVSLPVILFVDGHKTHLTYEVSKLCTELKIELIALYPNATRIMQPADVAVFRPVKIAWKKTAREWQQEHRGQIITKTNIAPIIQTALERSIKSDTLINGFKATGLQPFTPDAIDYSKCLGRVLINTNNTNIHNTVADINLQSTITLATFKTIIGESKFRELSTASADILSYDKNLTLLYKIWTAFDSSSHSLGGIVSTSPITASTLTLHDTPSTTTTASSTTFHNTDPYSALLSSYIHSAPNDTSDAEHHIEPSTSNKDCAEEQIKLMLDSSLKTYVNTPRKQIRSQADTSHTEIKTNPYWTSDVSPAFKIVSGSEFGSYLTTPKTPERKGKRNIEKMPYAITSEKYKKMLKEKIKKKNKEESDKEERKKNKEKKKLEKLRKEKPKSKQMACVSVVTINPPENTNKCPPDHINKCPPETTMKCPLEETDKCPPDDINKCPPETTMKCPLEETDKCSPDDIDKCPLEANTMCLLEATDKFPPGATIKCSPEVSNEYPLKATNQCYACKNHTKYSDRLICDTCSKIFHSKCIPKRHREHIPIEQHIDLFICHLCYKEHSDCDSDNVDEEDLYNLVCKKRRFY